MGTEVEIKHRYNTGCFGRRNDPIRIGQRSSYRLLQEQMLSGLKHGARQFRMSSRWSANRHRINFRAAHQFICGKKGLAYLELRGGPLKPAVIGVAEGYRAYIMGAGNAGRCLRTVTPPQPIIPTLTDTVSI